MLWARQWTTLPIWLMALSLVGLAGARTARGDWNNLSRFEAIAELQVEADALHLQLRLKPSLFDRLRETRAGQEPDSIPQWLGERLIQLQDGKGKGLVAVDGTLSVPPSTTASADPQAGYYTLDLKYPASERMPGLHILPAEPVAEGLLGLVVLHKGVPVSDLTGLNKPLALALDWVDPWRSRFDDSNLLRRHSEPRSYLYVEPYEVRHEVLIRLADLRSAMDLALKNPQRVEVDERAEVKQRIGAFLLQRNALVIDGKALKPQLDRIDFVGFSRAGIQPVAEASPVESAAALVGAVIVYLTEQPARQLNLHWELFGHGHDSRAVSVIQGNESFDGYMTQQQPVFEWSQEEAFETALTGEEVAMNEPQVAGELASLDEAQLKCLVQSLLHNAYRAFSLREEEAVYDRLAKTLADPLLEDIYLQQRRSLLQQAKGLGGEGRVERIEVLDVHRLDTYHPAGAGQPMLAVRWKAQGSVSHWGHSHPRDNLYAARLGLQRDELGGWKIAGMHFLDGQRLETAANP